MRAMKNRCARRDKNFLLQLGSRHMGIWADEAIVTDGTRVPGTAANDSVLHDDAVSTDANGAPALADNACSMQYSRTCADCDVAADRRIRCNPRGRINLRSLPCVFYEHFVYSSSF
jgi:hypothetical protein